MHFLTSPIVQGITLGLLAVQVAAAPNDINDPTYDSLMKRNPSVRSEILRRADSAAHSKVWADRVENYRNNHADTLTPEQSTVLDNAINSLDSGDRSVLPKLKEDAIAAFGFDEARKIATTLDGTTPAPKGDLQGRAPLCTCNTADDWCSDGYDCREGEIACNTIPNRCGWWEEGVCDGQCYSA